MSDSIPVPEEVAAFDRALEAANDRIAAETVALRERNRRLESLLAEKTVLLENLEATDSRSPYLSATVTAPTG